MTGAPGANGVYGYPRGTNGSYGGAAYTGRLGNTVENLTVLTGGSGGAARSTVSAAPVAAAARAKLSFSRVYTPPFHLHLVRRNSRARSHRGI